MRIIKSGSFVIIASLVMLTGVRAAFADATSPLLAASDPDIAKWITAIGVALAGIGLMFHGLSKLLSSIAPFTKTTLDDRWAVKFENLASSIDAIVSGVAKVFEIVSGPYAAQTPPKTSPEPPRNPQSGRVNLTMLALIALVAVSITTIETSGCATVQRGSEAIISCVQSADATKISAVETEIKKLTNWSDRYAHAAAYGAVIGGCALLDVAFTSPSAASFLPDEGRATFERFRREVAGGAQYQTSAGVQ
jgi:hypothetical protein